MTSATPPRHTLVFFHAHPDDEALLTAGTMAKMAEQGHRVVLVVATEGEAGLAASDLLADAGLARRRKAELDASAAALGVHRVVWLGYADSGMAEVASADRGGFSFADLDEAAARLAGLLDDEEADLLTVYDPVGGYGHPDHVQVHHVGVRAAELARRRPAVLEATVDRTSLVRAARLLRSLRWIAPGLEVPSFESAYTAREQLTHVVDVRAQLDAKRASMAAHASQATADTGTRTLALLLRLPRPLFRMVCGREWFVARGRAAGTVESDILSEVGGGR
ncbi:MAG: PIG-L deacetylase family protein [Nocardioidaceae bacterium]